VWIAVLQTDNSPLFPRLSISRQAVDNGPLNRSVYTPARLPDSPALCTFRGYEADLSAERAQTKAEARLSRGHVHARRPPSPDATPRQGAQAPVGVGRAP